MQTILDWIQNFGTLPVVVIGISIYTIIMKVVKRLNKDKDEIVPLLDTIFDIPTKYQKKSLEYHKAKTEKYKILKDSDIEKEKYKKYKNNKKEKKRKAQRDSFKRVTNKLKSMYQKFRKKWIR